MKELIRSLIPSLVLSIPLVALSYLASTSVELHIWLVNRLQSFGFWIVLFFFGPTLVELTSEAFYTVYWYVLLKRKAEEELLKVMLQNDWPTQYLNDPELYLSLLVNPDERSYRPDQLSTAYAMLQSIVPRTRGGSGTLISVLRQESSFRRVFAQFNAIKKQ